MRITFIVSDVPAVRARPARPLPCSLSTTRPTLDRKSHPPCFTKKIARCTACHIPANTQSRRLVNILRAAKQPVPDELLKFGTTVKKKGHESYGAFFKDVDMSQKGTKITFD